MFITSSTDIFKGVSYKLPCGICSLKKISWNCTDCCMFICNTCKSNHLQIPTCKDHSILGIEMVVKDKTKELQHICTGLEKHYECIDTQIGQLLHYLDDVDKRKDCLENDIDDYRDKIITKVQDHCSLLKNKITIILNDQHKRNPTVNNLESLQLDKTDIGNDIHTLRSLICNQDCAVLLKCADETVRNFHYKLKQLNANYQTQLTTLEKFEDIRVIKGNFIGLDLALANTLAIETCEKNDLGENNNNLYKWTNPNLNTQHEQQIHCNDCNSITLVNNNIWCVYDKKIVIYDANGKFYKSFNNITSGRALTYLSHPGYFIVACSGVNNEDSGLQLYNNKAIKIKVLISGRFVDMDTIDNCGKLKTIAVLEYNQSEIKVFAVKYELTFTGDEHGGIHIELQHLSTITPELAISMFDTISITNHDHIIVASFCYNTITKYNIQGKTVCTYDNNSNNEDRSLPYQRLKNPRLCCSDKNNNVLMINFGSPNHPPLIMNEVGVLQALSHRLLNSKCSFNRLSTETLSVWPAQNEVKCLHAAIDSDCERLWVLQMTSKPSVLGVQHYSIHKYKLSSTSHYSVLKNIMSIQILIFIFFIFAMISQDNLIVWLAIWGLNFMVLYINFK